MKQIPFKSLSVLIFTLFTLAVSAQRNEQILGEWYDIENPEKQIEMYLHEGKFYGKNTTTSKIIFKDLIWDVKANAYRGKLINPDNDEVFEISIELFGNELFQFTAGKFIFKKQFQFKRLQK